MRPAPRCWRSNPINAHIRAPGYFIGKTPSAPRGIVWAASGIREMLHNPRYTGTIIYGQHRNTYKKGRAKLREAQDEANWVQIQRPELRIVDEQLWSAVQTRLAAEAEAYSSQSAGLIDRQRHSQYLLSGLMVCGVCEHRMVAIRNSYGGGSTRCSIVSYMCGGYKKSGQTRCSNSVRKPAEMFETEILRILKTEFLSPFAIEALTREIGELLQQESAPQQQVRDNLREELKKIDREMENLWALAAEGAPAGLASRIKSREERKETLEQQLAELENQTQIDPKQIEHLKISIKASLEDLGNVLKEGGDQARKVLREFLGDQPIRCEPMVEGRKKSYRLSIPFSFRTVALEPTIQMLASPRGIEPRPPP
ncbi:recombinase family protein [Formivibrio citricus]|uniref:recombinase family protein n=1 Tax=Formivibrio citricus TaxID=83765 RepID=UPI0035714DF4